MYTPLGCESAAGFMCMLTMHHTSLMLPADPAHMTELRIARVCIYAGGLPAWSTQSMPKAVSVHLEGNEIHGAVPSGYRQVPACFWAHEL